MLIKKKQLFFNLILWLPSLEGQPFLVVIWYDLAMVRINKHVRSMRTLLAHLSYLLVWVEIWNSHYIIVLKSCTSPAGTWIWLSSWQPISKQRTTCYEMVHLRLFTLTSQESDVFIFALSLIITAWFDRPRPFHFAIVDEVDSVLIDEGRNPLLISGEV